MNRRHLFFLLSGLVVQAGFLMAQTEDRPAPWFSLSIAEKHLSGEYAPGSHVLDVTYTNTSDKFQSDACMKHAFVYNMVVLRDGAPLEKRNAKQPKKEKFDKPGTIKVPFTEANTCMWNEGSGLKPGQSIIFPVWITTQYEISQPGTYTVTVNRETFPFEPAKSVTVWSNTLTIVVPASAGKAPAKP